MTGGNYLLFIFVIIILVSIAGAGYLFFAQNIGVDGNQALLGASSGEEAISDVVITLGMLENLGDIDTSLFDNPAFTSLKDFRLDVYSVPEGRNNPFAPIGDVFVPAGSSRGGSSSGSSGGGNVINLF